MAAKEKIIKTAQVSLSAEEQSCWYAINTKSAKEDCVVANISRMGLEAFNPKIKPNRNVWGTPKEFSVPLFPCYVFAKFGAPHVHSISYVRGVRRIVGFGATPVDNSIIESIQSRVITEQSHARATEFRPGEQVVVNRGAFYGLEGLFVEELRGKERVIILLKAIGMQAQVQVDKSAIQKSPAKLN